MFFHIFPIVYVTHLPSTLFAIIRDVFYLNVATNWYYSIPFLSLSLSRLGQNDHCVILRSV